MNNLNSVLLEGVMVRKPMFRITVKEKVVCNFTIVSNRMYQEEDHTIVKEVSFFDIETWGTLAKACGKIGKKGCGVRVVGRLKQERWTGTDGKTHSKMIVEAEHVEFRPDLKGRVSEAEGDAEEETGYNE